MQGKVRCKLIPSPAASPPPEHVYDLPDDQARLRKQPAGEDHRCRTNNTAQLRKRRNPQTAPKTLRFPGFFFLLEGFGCTLALLIPIGIAQGLHLHGACVQGSRNRWDERRACPWREAASVIFNQWHSYSQCGTELTWLWGLVIRSARHSHEGARERGVRSRRRPDMLRLCWSLWRKMSEKNRGERCGC